MQKLTLYIFSFLLFIIMFLCFIFIKMEFHIGSINHKLARNIHHHHTFVVSKISKIPVAMRLILSVSMCSLVK